MFDEKDDSAVKNALNIAYANCNKEITDKFKRKANKDELRLSFKGYVFFNSMMNEIKAWTYLD